jgi:hypothetical protein
MKTTRSLLVCLAFAFLLVSCEEEWPKKDAQMGYVVDITENNDGTCTYLFGASPDDKTGGHPTVTDCGRWKLRDGIFIPQ